MTDKEIKALERCKELIKESHSCWIGLSNQDAINTMLQVIERQNTEIQDKDKKIEHIKNLNKHQSKEIAKTVDYTFELNKEIEKNENIIKNVYREANNILYLDDSSDYGGALWDILRIINPDLEEYPTLKYIKEEEE